MSDSKDKNLFLGSDFLVKGALKKNKIYIFFSGNVNPNKSLHMEI